MAEIEVRRIYPGTSRLALSSAPVNHLSLLKTAVTELAVNFPRRGRHIDSAVNALAAVARRDRNYFIDLIPESLIDIEIQRFELNRDVYTSRYFRQLEQFFDLHAGLPPQQKEVLELAVWGHDLGVPFGIEWEHPWHGSEVIRELICDKKVQQPVSALVTHHGEYTNLLSSSFPRDIYQLPRNLQKLLLILDFCDATARINKAGTEVNPVGLKTISFYTLMIPESGLARLEDPEYLFELRCVYGFAPIIFNNPEIDQATLDGIFEAIAQLNPAFDNNRVKEFFGSQFRCNFMDLMLNALQIPSAKAKLFATIYDAYHHSQLTGDVLLWPDLDLGRKLGENPEIFIKAFAEFAAQRSISDLFVPLPFRGQILLQVSKLMGK